MKKRLKKKLAKKGLLDYDYKKSPKPKVKVLKRHNRPEPKTHEEVWGHIKPNGRFGSNE